MGKKNKNSRSSSSPNASSYDKQDEWAIETAEVSKSARLLAQANEEAIAAAASKAISNDLAVVPKVLVVTKKTTRSGRDYSGDSSSFSNFADHSVNADEIKSKHSFKGDVFTPVTALNTPPEENVSGSNDIDSSEDEEACQGRGIRFNNILDSYELARRKQMMRPITPLSDQLCNKITRLVQGSRGQEDNSETLSKLELSVRKQYEDLKLSKPTLGLPLKFEDFLEDVKKGQEFSIYSKIEDDVAKEKVKVRDPANEVQEQGLEVVMPKLEENGAGNHKVFNKGAVQTQLSSHGLDDERNEEDDGVTHANCPARGTHVHDRFNMVGPMAGNMRGLIQDLKHSLDVCSQAVGTPAYVSATKPHVGGQPTSGKRSQPAALASAPHLQAATLGSYDKCNTQISAAVIAHELSLSNDIKEMEYRQGCVHVHPADTHGPASGPTTAGLKLRTPSIGQRGALEQPTSHVPSSPLNHFGLSSVLTSAKQRGGTSVLEPCKHADPIVTAQHSHSEFLITNVDKGDKSSMTHFRSNEVADEVVSQSEHHVADVCSLSSSSGGHLVCDHSKSHGSCVFANGASITTWAGVLKPTVQTPQAFGPVGAQLHPVGLETNKEAFVTEPKAKTSWSGLFKPYEHSFVLDHIDLGTCRDGRKLRVPTAVTSPGLHEWQNTLVGFFLDRKLPYSLVHKVTSNLWAKAGLNDILATDQGTFYFKFHSSFALEAVLEGGPWYVAGKPLFLRKWAPHFSAAKDRVTKVPVWVHFFNIPLEYWTPEGLSYIASMVGKPLHVDKMTASRRRITYARICIEVDAKEDWLTNFELEAEGPSEDNDPITIHLEYQWTPTRCSVCKSFGHDCNKKAPVHHAYPNLKTATQWKQAIVTPKGLNEQGSPSEVPREEGEWTEVVGKGKEKTKVNLERGVDSSSRLRDHSISSVQPVKVSNSFHGLTPYVYEAEALVSLEGEQHQESLGVSMEEGLSEGEWGIHAEKDVVVSPTSARQKKKEAKRNFSGSRPKGRH